MYSLFLLYHSLIKCGSPSNQVCCVPTGEFHLPNMTEDEQLELALAESRKLHAPQEDMDVLGQIDNECASKSATVSQPDGDHNQLIDDHELTGDRGSNDGQCVSKCTT